MISKVALFFCVSALTVQTITAQCLGAYNGLATDALIRGAAVNALGWDAAPWGPAAPLAYAAGAPLAAPWGPVPYAAEVVPYGPAPFVPSSGGSFKITSASPIAPTGIRITSENAYEGPLVISGTLPFLGAVAMEGALPTAGAGAINYGCGNGNVGIVSEDLAGYNAIGPLGYRAEIAGPALGYNGFAGPFGYERIGYGGCGAYYIIHT